MKNENAIGYAESSNPLRRVYDRLIVRLYRKVRSRQDFVQSIHDVNVKKGKRRYTLMVVETGSGSFKFNLGRH